MPIPWSGTRPPFGFSPDGASAPPWLPQPPAWRELTVEAQSRDPDSMLALYRAALGLRRSRPALGDGTLRWLPAPDGALMFAREPGFLCLVNLSSDPLVPPAGELLLASGPLLGDGRVPADTAVWLEG